LAGGALIIEGTTFFLRTAAGNEFRGDIRIDPSKSPKHLDFVHEKGGPVWEAIYAVAEDTLRLNYAETGDGGVRPTLFATSSETGGTIIVMNRMAER
jgi:uncharacterized protein (TIGR03067 family)